MNRIYHLIAAHNPAWYVSTIHTGSMCLTTNHAKAESFTSEGIFRAFQENPLPSIQLASVECDSPNMDHR